MKLTAKKAYEIDREVDKLVGHQQKVLLFLCKVLYQVRADEMYKALDYDTFESYLASKKLNYKTVLAYLNIYNVFVNEYKYSLEDLVDAPMSNLQMILPAVRGKDKKEVEEWLQKARTLSRSDLNIERKEEQANENFKDKKPYPIIFRCDVCGKWSLPKDLEVCKCI